MKNKKDSKFNKIFLIFSRVLIGILIAFLSVLIAGVFKANIFPMKFLIMIIVFALILSIILGILLWRRNDTWFKAIISLITIGICVISYFGITYLNNTYNFINNLVSSEYEEINYNVIVMKEADITSINDLENKTIGLLSNNSDNVIKSLSEKIYFTDNINEEASSLLDGLYNHTYNAIVVDDDVLELLQSDSENNFSTLTKVLYTFKVSTKVSLDNVTKINVSKEPFIMYISGIDQYGKVNTVRGRSDVNIVVIVNPKTNRILLLNTPRDYYVELHGKTGLRDKLTHAGVYGIDLSMTTLEDLYGIDINYYLRVNFDTVINLVDVINGIDVYSDTEFDSYHIKGWHVKKGINSLDGKKALAYSRERYAYMTGDRHRGQNQQDVINAIIKKTTSSKVLLTKYNDILNTLNGSFQTNMPIDMINDFIKYQLNEMPSWTVESISVSGRDGSEYTYSYGTRQKLYVMIPYEKDIVNAKNKIKEVLNYE